MKLFSSTFISIILAFLMFSGYNDQINISQNSIETSHFQNIYKDNLISGGNESNIKIEIFDDFTCQNCTYFAKNTVSKIKSLEQDYENINITLYFVPDSENKIYYKSALSLKCASEQNKFWDMHLKLHQNKDNLTLNSFLTIAKELELKSAQFQECMENETYKDKVREDFEYSINQSVKKTPTILIGQYRLIGNQPFENIEYIVNKLISNF